MGTHYRGSREEIRALDAYIKFIRAANTLRARVEGWLRQVGLTESQFGVLEMLLHLGPLRQCDIGTRLLISRANVTLVVDQLADRGFLRRERDTSDRRSNVVHLTAEGRRRVRGLFPPHARRITAAMGALTPSEIDELARLSRKLGLALASTGDTR